MDIVVAYRLLYRNYYMAPISVNIGQQLECQAFDEKGNGFPDQYIRVDFTGISHPKILAATCTVEDKNKKPIPCISCSTSLQQESKAKQKFFLAHEWLHAIAALMGETKRTDEGIDKLLLYRMLKQKDITAYWADTPKETVDLHRALRLLLVSQESLDEMLQEDHKMSLKELAVMVDNRKNTAADIIMKLGTAFAVTWDVEIGLVYDRTLEEVYKRPHENIRAKK